MRSRSRRLTTRERQLAALIRLGLTNKDIAERLNISEETVKRHLSSLMLKLNVFNRVQIAVIAERQGWSNRHTEDIQGAP